MNTTKTQRLQAPVIKIKKYIDSNVWNREALDIEVLEFLGVFLLRGFFSEEVIGELLGIYRSDQLKQAVPFHPTRVETPDGALLNKLLTQPKLNNLLSNGYFFGGNVAADHPLVFRKDAENYLPVMLHNDIDYMAGTKEAYSLFFALTPANRENGGLVLYPATHHFGSLGDAGEIDPTALPDGYPSIVTDMNPGDLLIMNSATWHCSGPNLSGENRIYLELKIRDANNPVAGIIVSGERTSEFCNKLKKEEVFVSSRESRLKNLYKQLSSHQSEG